MKTIRVTAKRTVVIREVRCQTILNRSRIPGVDYALNPYLGCQHGCVYCYSDFMRRFHQHTEDWGWFVDIKTNAHQVLQNQLKRVKPGLVTLSTVTDPYQPAEQKYRLTRACLKALVDAPLSVSVLTKSDLILRDIDILKMIKDLDVGFTITTLREPLRGVFEPGAPSVRRRLRALEEIAAAGISTWVFLGPVLPVFSDHTRALGELLATFRDHGAGRVLVDRLNFYPRVWARVRSTLAARFPQYLTIYEQIKGQGGAYARLLRQRVQEEADLAGIACEIVF